jgi:NCS1 family nucleobase:cation symporter-1
MALGGNLVWMTIAVLLGCAFRTFFMAFHSTQGPQLGLPQMIQSRPQFGYLGALLVWCVALATFVGYNAFNQVLAADTVVTLVGWNRPLTMVTVGVIATVLAVPGYDVIHKAQRLLAYVLLAVFAVMTGSCAGLRAVLHGSAARFGRSHAFEGEQIRSRCTLTNRQ